MPASSRSRKPASWPEPVERFAAVVRAAGVDGRIEELPAGVDEPPGSAVEARAFDCDGRLVVVLVPFEREVEPEKLGTVVRPTTAPSFPYAGARVVLERSLLAESLVWLEAGSPRHVLGLTPSHLVRLTKAETADVLREA